MPIQLTNLMPVGTAIRNETAEKNGLLTAPVVNMWCAHTPIESPAMANAAITMSNIAENRLVRERRDDLGDHAEVRQDHHVDFGMAEEPEQVLVEHWIAAVEWVEEAAPACRSIRTIAKRPSATGTP